MAAKASGGTSSLRVDRVIHEPARLAIMGILGEGYQADYTFLKNTLALTDGNLASHLRTLEDAGYIEVKKQFLGRKTNTMYAATKAGKQAYAEYREVMLSLLLPSNGEVPKE